jgi:predicted dehydrogenase
LAKSWRFDKQIAGAGALGDLGSHHIDLARFLIGEVSRCAALTTTLIANRPGGQVTNDDAFVAIAELSNGATATFEGSRVAGNHSLTSRIEVDGERGSIRFDFERLNELSISERGRHGFRTYLVTQAEHPLSNFWFPVGIQGQHPIGWADCFAHQAHCMLTAVGGKSALPEYAPTFRDGYRVAETIETVQRAAETGTWETVKFREPSSPIK